MTEIMRQPAVHPDPEFAEAVADAARKQAEYAEQRRQYREAHPLVTRDQSEGR